MTFSTKRNKYYDCFRLFEKKLNGDELNQVKKDYACNNCFDIFIFYIWLYSCFLFVCIRVRETIIYFFNDMIWVGTPLWDGHIYIRRSGVWWGTPSMGWVREILTYDWLMCPIPKGSLHTDHLAEISPIVSQTLI